ncbi:MAG: globin domain-containing protein [Chitinophagaceae bacterium]
MTEEQIAIVKRTWKIFRAIDPVLVGDAFYSKLFADNPALRKMFPKQMDAQYRKLIDMLSTIVIRLDRIDELKEDIIAMGQRHVQYGVKPDHYKLVGNAFMWTLQQGLGSDWTAETELAWRTCYNSLADAMIAASKPQAAK